MIALDGSLGEGGGQILRSALAMSLATRTPFRIEHIRAGRRRPGLMRQHLTAVNAAVEVGRAGVKGNRIGSTDLLFAPETVGAGRYHFAVGTAGSATLVLQTVLPALLTAKAPSELVLEGGTHNPYAPPFDFLEKAFLPVINRMGPNVTAELERPGFYPAGGGKFRVCINPSGRIARHDLTERGDVVRHEAIAMLAQLPRNIGAREVSALRQKLSWPDSAFRIKEVRGSVGPGNIVIAIVESRNVTEVFTGFGQRGVPAEHVAEAVVKPVREYLASGVPVGRYLADQLMIPMVLAGGGQFVTLPLSRHATTNIDVLQKFVDLDVSVTKVDRAVWHVRLERK